MTSVVELRDPSVTREELQDLLKYINGLPSEARRTGAFLAYEQRVADLSRELILSDMLAFARQIPFGFSADLAAGNATELGQMREALSLLKQQYSRAAAWSQRANRMLHWGLVALPASGVISAVFAPSLVIPFGVVAASLAGVYVGGFGERARKHERTAAYLSNLLEEIDSSFGPSGEVLGVSEYYPANAKRIEVLLDAIKASVE
jgi:hypothetical protein